MSTMKEKIDDVFQALKDFDGKSKSQLSMVEEKQNEIRTLLHQKELKIQSHLKDIIIKENHPYYNDLLALKESILKTFTIIMVEEGRVVEQQEFFKENLDSFIISVYGKVKTGKSSLSNLLGGYYLRDYPGERPTFFTYKNGENIKIILDESEGFFVDTLEATNTIQGFSKDRLLWVDTPGLDATLQNEQLANDFIEKSDLVLFLTCGSAPLRKGDKEKLDWLYKRNKPTLLVITKSDDSGEPIQINGEWIEDYLCAKSDAGKKDQLLYIQKEYEDTELLELILQNGGILHISTLLSLYGFNESDLYEERVKEHFKTYLDYENRLIPNRDWSEESQLLVLLDQIKTTLTSNAVQYKIENPKRRLIAFIREYLINESTGKIVNLQGLVNLGVEALIELDLNIKNLIEKKEKEKLYLKIESSVNKILSKYQYKKKINKHEFNQELNKAIKDTLNLFIKEQIEKVIKAYEESININLKRLNIDIQMVTKEEQVEVNHPLAQIIGKSGGAALGYAIGSFFGPAGRRIGITIGSQIGTVVGDYFTSIQTIQVEIGNDLISQSKEILEDIFNESLEIYTTFFRDLLLQYVDPLLQSLLFILDDIIDLKKELKIMEFNLCKGN